jgi:hypothetical protein
MLCVQSEDRMSHKELEAIKKAAVQFKQECNTPEKVQAHLIKIGYLSTNGKIARKSR